MIENKLFCPFCNKKLEPIGTSGQFQCGTWGCDASFNFIATRDVWEYIDRTRKALDVAVDALNKILNAQGRCWGATDTDIKFDCKHYADEALEQINEITKGGKDE